MFQMKTNVVNNESKNPADTSAASFGESLVSAVSISQTGDKYALLLTIHHGMLQADVQRYEVEKIPNIGTPYVLSASMLKVTISDKPTKKV